MNRSRFGLVSAIAAVCCCLLGVAGCTSGSTGVNLQTLPTSSSPSPSSVSVPDSSSSPSISSAPPVSTSVTTAAPTSSNTPSTSTALTATTPHTASTSAVTQETADRAAIQAVWIKYWVAVGGLFQMPAAERASAMNAVAVPLQTKVVLAETATLVKKGLVTYGTATIIHRITWPAPVAGRATAVMSDCLDDYNYGTMDAKTGRKLTAGVHPDNTQITVVRQADGSWKVSQVLFLVKIPC